MSQVPQNPPESRAVPVVSPDGSLVVTVEAVGSSDVYYSLSYKGRPLIERSAIGRFMLRNAPPLGGSWTLTGVVTSSADETYKLPWGPVKTVRNRYNEAVIDFRESHKPGRMMTLVVRVYDEGAAFRYVFPEQPGLAEMQFTGELTSFRFPADYTAFIAKADDFRSYELEYPRSKLSAIQAGDKVRLPLLIKEEVDTHVDGGSDSQVRREARCDAWMAITEAELVDYAGMYLTRGADADTLVSILSPYPDDPELRVVAYPPLATPWRVIMVADSPGKLIENNTLILNLNPPSKIKDTSWIKPGLSAWHWWSGHKACGGTFVVPNFESQNQGQGQTHEPVQTQTQSQALGQSKGKGPAPAPTPTPTPTTKTETVAYEPFPGRVDNQTIRYYTDFAAAHGFAYNLIDAGWYSSEGDAWAKPLELDITQQLPPIDIPEMVRYARRRGVGIWIWVHAASLEQQLDEAFALYKKWGVVGVKVDSYGRDDQPFVRFINKMVEKAAEYQLLIDFHGAYKPTGIRRTWPNFLTSEAVLGLEYAKFSSIPGRPSPTHNVTIPFTRMLAGPMDYTPGYFGTIDLGLTVKGTRAHQLAMYVVYESPLQMVSDTPMAYEGQVGIDFLERVPATWDETRVVAGEPGAYVTIARRSGDEWYVGTMTNEEPRVLEIPLDFLGDGEYVAHIYEDSHFEPCAAEVHDPAATATNQAGTRMRQEMVNCHTVLIARLASGGGQAVRLTPATANAERE